MSSALIPSNCHFFKKIKQGAGGTLFSFNIRRFSGMVAGRLEAGRFYALI
jgi:hypothetical protein